MWHVVKRVLFRFDICFMDIKLQTNRYDGFVTVARQEIKRKVNIICEVTFIYLIIYISPRTQTIMITYKGMVTIYTA
jgi:hypothetical protein